MDIETLKGLLQQAWSADTAQGEWTPECPSVGQCAVTALVTQDYFGGKLLRCKTTSGNSHYWNQLPDGTEVDLTAPQFDFIPDKPLKDEHVFRDREYVLSFPATLLRYEKLKENLKRLIA